MNRFAQVLMLSFLFFSFASASWEKSDQSTNITIELLEPVLKIEIMNDTLNMGNLTKGFVSDEQKITIRNSGTMDAIVRPEISTKNEISEYLLVSNSTTDAYFKKISDQVFNLSVKKPTSQGGYKDTSMYFKLDLTDYEGNQIGNITTNIIFWVMPA